MVQSVGIYPNRLYPAQTAVAGDKTAVSPRAKKLAERAGVMIQLMGDK